MIRYVSSVLSVLSCLILCSAISGQTITASVEGRVTDSSGAVVSGAAVKAVNSQIGFSRTMTTDAGGGYKLSAVPVGEYTITVEAQGFRPESKAIRLVVGQSASLDFLLQTGGVTEKVDIE